MSHPLTLRLRGVALSACLLLVTAAGLSLAGGSSTWAAGVATRTVCAEGCDFTTIQAAVAVSLPEDVVEVHAGDYTLDDELVIEDVNLRAVGEVTVAGTGTIKPMRTGGNPSNSIAGFTFDGVTIDSGPNEDALYIVDNTFLNYTGAAISNGDPTSAMESTAWTISGNVFTGGASAIQLSRMTKLEISGNTITGTTSDAIVIANSTPGSTGRAISGNTISDGEAGGIKIVDSVDITILNNVLQNLPSFGISRDNTAPLGPIDPPSTSADTSVIRDNTLINTGTTGDGAAAIVFAGTDYLAPTEVTYNTINGSAIGVLFAADTTDDLETFATLHYNDLSGNDLGVSGEGAATVDATLNWWGDADPTSGSGLDVELPGEVTYVPYATVADFSTMSGSQVLTVGSGETYTTIQDAIDAAAPGDTVKVLAGDYDVTDGLRIERSVHLIGPKADVDPATAPDERGTGEAILGSSTECTSDSACSSIDLVGILSNITISGFTLDGVDIQANQAGSRITRSVEVSNNIFDGQYNAVGGNAGPDWVVTKNLFRGVGHTAVFLNHAYNIRIAGNAVLNPSAAPSYGAFIITAAEDFSVTGNTVENTTNHGTNVENFSGENVIADNVYRGVLADSATYGAIRIKGGTGSDGSVSITGNAVSGSRAAVVLDSKTTGDIAVDIHENDLSGNTLGVESLGSADVDATLNWWGSAAPDFDALTEGTMVTDPWYLNAAMTTTSEQGTTPEDDGAATATPEKPTVVVEPGDKPVDVIVSEGTDDPAVDYSALQDGDGKVVVPADTTMTRDDGTTVLFPVDTTVTPSGAWDGVIAAPTVLPADSVNVPGGGDGSTPEVTTVIKLGSDDVSLSFDRAVRILLPGEAGSLVGFVEGDSEFTPITTECTADTQVAGDAVVRDCYMEVGDDLVVWTKHFTTYIAYRLSGGTGGLASTGVNAAPLWIAGSSLLLLGALAMGAVGYRRRRV